VRDVAGEAPMQSCRAVVGQLAHVIGDQSQDPDA